MALETTDRADPLSSLVAQARASEDAGLELLWCPADAAEPALLAAAVASVRTQGIRLVAEIDTGTHPLASAESAVVADNCSNGRVILMLADPDGDRELMEETLQLLLAGLAARPLQHCGKRWQSPANLPENDGTERRITVTPRAPQLEMPVWLRGPSALELSISYGLSEVVDGLDPEAATARWEHVEQTLGKHARRLSRPCVLSLDVDASGDFDDDGLVRSLRAHQLGWGLDAAVIRVPLECDNRARARAAWRLATRVRPRVTLDQLPTGVEEHWRTHLPPLLAAAGLDGPS